MPERQNPLGDLLRACSLDAVCRNARRLCHLSGGHGSNPMVLFPLGRLGWAHSRELDPPEREAARGTAGAGKPAAGAERRPAGGSCGRHLASLQVSLVGCGKQEAVISGEFDISQKIQRNDNRNDENNLLGFSIESARTKSEGFLRRCQEGFEQGVCGVGDHGLFLKLTFDDIANGTDNSHQDSLVRTHCANCTA